MVRLQSLLHVPHGRILFHPCPCDDACGRASFRVRVEGDGGGQRVCIRRVIDHHSPFLRCDHLGRAVESRRHRRQPGREGFEDGKGTGVVKRRMYVDVGSRIVALHGDRGPVNITLADMPSFFISLR